MTRTYSQIDRANKYSEHSSIIWSVCPNGWVFVYKLSGSGFKSSWIDLNFNFCACFQQEVPWHSSNYRVWNNLKCVHDMKRTYSEMDRADNYSEHSSIIWSVQPNGWVFLYQLSGFGFESSCSHLNFRFIACFEQGLPWHSGNYGEWIHSEMRTWYGKNIQPNAR